LQGKPGSSIRLEDPARRLILNSKRGSVFILIFGLMALAGCAAPTAACPTPTIDTELLTNAADGYCLLYPTKYSAEIPGLIVINPIAGPGDIPGDAWASIGVEPAHGRTAGQVADAEIESAGPGFNIMRSETIVDYEQAVVLDGLPGPDPWRRVFIVHDNRLYTLSFLPWRPDAADAAQQIPLESLYTTIMRSLHFLPLESGASAARRATLWWNSVSLILK